MPPATPCRGPGNLGFDMTAEAALTKLHFLLSQELPSHRIRELMQQSLRGELTP